MTVVKFPKRNGRALRFKEKECCHGEIESVEYFLHEGEAFVTCVCGAKLDPMFVLKVLCIQEQIFEHYEERRLQQLAMLERRSRTKCQRCGEMTPIRRV